MPRASYVALDQLLPLRLSRCHSPACTWFAEGFRRAQSSSARRSAAMMYALGEASIEDTTMLTMLLQGVPTPFWMESTHRWRSRRAPSQPAAGVESRAARARLRRTLTLETTPAAPRWTPGAGEATPFATSHEAGAGWLRVPRNPPAPCRSGERPSQRLVRGRAGVAGVMATPWCARFRRKRRNGVDRRLWAVPPGQPVLDHLRRPTRWRGFVPGG